MRLVCRERRDDTLKSWRNLAVFKLALNPVIFRTVQASGCYISNFLEITKTPLQILQFLFSFVQNADIYY